MPKHIENNKNPFLNLLFDVSGLTDKQRFQRVKKLVIEAKKSIDKEEAKTKPNAIGKDDKTHKPETSIPESVKGILPTPGIGDITEDEVEKEIIREKVRTMKPLIKEIDKFIDDAQKGVRVDAEKIAL